MTLTEFNNGYDTMCRANPYRRLASGAKIVKSDIVGNLSVDMHSCINRCRVGRYVSVGCFSYFADCEIGRYCTFGARISVGAFSHPTDWLSIHEFQYRNTANIYGESLIDNDVNYAPRANKTSIGNDVWIGDNASVRAGTSVGHGAIVGLGAVVVSDVPPYAIVGGNPARVLRYRFSEDIIAELLGLKWWELDLPHLKGADFSDIEKAIEFLTSKKSGMRGK
jgi:acetyltransferase-like isoleucine patch superfamily enzyme